MSSLEIGMAAVAVMLVMILIGVPIAISLFLSGFGGIAFMRGNVELAGVLTASSIYADLSKYIFGTIPLFILMGVLIAQSSIGRETFYVMHRGLNWLRGGLGIATVGANAVFAAVTGVSIASVAVFSKVAVPEMLRYGYDTRFAVGVVAGSSVLGMMLPPSLLLIVYAILAEVSIGDMFVAGILPGLLIAVTYAIAIIGFGYFRPAMVGHTATPSLPVDDPLAGRSSFMLLGPVVLLIVIVLGGIYSGIFSPTESGAAGALAALLIVAAKRQLTWRKLGAILHETASVTAAVAIILAAAAVYGKMLTFSGLPSWIAGSLSGSGMEFMSILVIYLILLIVLGLLLDSTSILLIAVPLFLPVMLAGGADPIWFGIITVLAVEIGLLTPPVGLACFVLKSSLSDRDISLQQIFAGALPFAILMVVVLTFIVLVPGTATFLVHLSRG